MAKYRSLITRTRVIKEHVVVLSNSSSVGYVDRDAKCAAFDAEWITDSDVRSDLIVAHSEEI